MRDENNMDRCANESAPSPEEVNERIRAYKAKMEAKAAEQAEASQEPQDGLGQESATDTPDESGEPASESAAQSLGALSDAEKEKLIAWGKKAIEDACGGLKKLSKAKDRESAVAALAKKLAPLAWASLASIDEVKAALTEAVDGKWTAALAEAVAEGLKTESTPRHPVLRFLKQLRAKAANATNGEPASGDNWKHPVPVPSGLFPVAVWSYDFLPPALQPWARDAVERLQCPPDFVGASIMAGLGAALGRKIGIRPQQHTIWIEFPNLWVCIVGNPGIMKSPAMDEALKPVTRLEIEATKRNEAAMKDFNRALEAYECLRKASEKKGGPAPLKPEKPVLLQHIVMNATFEALCEVLIDNPDGALAYRDELLSLLKSLDREENAEARGLYKTAYSGKGMYKLNRIGRGNRHVEDACLSILGAAQPGPVANYIRRSSKGDGDDGLLQRFMIVWPDLTPEWKNVDRYPDAAARDKAFGVFDRLSKLTGFLAAECDPYERAQFLHFDAEAQLLFDSWHAALQLRLRSGGLNDALAGHLSKYRKLVPALALINHLADGRIGRIGKEALQRALDMAAYFETHARRAYGSVAATEASAAKAILARIRKGDLKDGFTARDVYRNHWAGISDRELVLAALDLLDDLGWISGEKVEKVDANGRPTVKYTINPKTLA